MINKINALVAALVLTVAPMASVNAENFTLSPSPPTYQARNSKVNLGFIRTWAPFSEGFTSTIANTNWVKGTHGFAGAIELEDDFDAVQILIGTSSTSAGWTWTGGTVTGSAAYGSNALPGITPLDPLGNTLTSAYPITFLNAGVNSAPYPGNTLVNGSGNGTLSLALSAQTNSASATLTFTSTNTDLRTGGMAIQNGMFVTDLTTGCIPNGTTISGTTATQTTMSANATCNILSGQQLFFSWVAINAAGTTIAVPQSTVTGQIQFIHSDWIPVSSLPRVDGGVVAGMGVSGACIAGGTTVTSITPSTINLSQAVSGTCSTTTAISLTEAPTVANAVVSGSYTISLSSMVGIQAGQTVTGTNIAANTWVTGVYGNSVTLNNAVTGAVAQGATLTFTNTVYATSSTASGTSLPVMSTSNKRLLLIRAFATATGATNAGWVRNTGDDTAMQAVGLPRWKFYLAGGTNGVDVEGNWTNAAGLGAFTQAPIFAVKYLSRHRGATVLSCGDSLTAGDSTAGDNSNFVARGAAAISSLNLPVSFASRALGSTSPASFIPMCNDMIASASPEIVSIQGWSSDATPPSPGYTFPVNTYMSYLEQLCNKVHGYGGNCIIHTRTPQQIIHTGQEYTSGSSSASTTLTLAKYWSAAQASAVPVSGTGIPAGTTATWANGQNTITLSQAATVPDHTLINLGDMINSANTSATTAITFTSNWWMPSGTYNVTCPGQTGTPTITLTKGSAAGTFSTNQTIAINSVCTFGLAYANTANAELSLALERSLGAAGIWTVFDAFAPIEDPANPANYLAGTSDNGVHANDYGHGLLAAPYASTLSNIIQ